MQSILLSCVIAVLCLAATQAWKLNSKLNAAASVRIPAAVLTSFFLVGGPIDSTLLQHQPLTAHQVTRSIVPSAHAEFRAAQKRTYFRYTPKLVEGGEFLKKDASVAVDKEDWPVIEKMFEVYASKMNGSQKDQVDQTDTYANSHYFRPMTILAGSFAERGSSEKQRTLMEQEKLMSDALDKLSGSVLPHRGEGFFAGMVPPPTGADRKAQAQAAITDAKAAYNEYVRVLNGGLMLELNKLSAI